VATRGVRTEIIAVGDDLDHLGETLRQRRPDLVVNLVTRFAGNPRLAPDVAAALETLGLRYTGAGPAGLWLGVDDQLQRRLLLAHGLPLAHDDAAAQAEIALGVVGNETVDLLPVGAPPASLVEAAGDLVRLAWAPLRLHDYALVRAIVDASGAPRIVSVEPNPTLAMDGVLATAARRAGWTYEALIGRIIDEAHARGEDAENVDAPGAA
jgi:D-alanine-D-alanine ligase-like ATP-grasp enzyme